MKAVSKADSLDSCFLSSWMQAATNDWFCKISRFPKRLKRELWVLSLFRFLHFLLIPLAFRSWLSLEKDKLYVHYLASQPVLKLMLFIGQIGTYWGGKEERGCYGKISLMAYFTCAPISSRGLPQVQNLLLKGSGPIWCLIALRFGDIEVTDGMHLLPAAAAAEPAYDLRPHHQIKDRMFCVGLWSCFRFGKKEGDVFGFLLRETLSQLTLRPALYNAHTITLSFLLLITF